MKKVVLVGIILLSAVFILYANNIYECRNCGVHISSKDSPNSGSCQARNGNSHNWRKLAEVGNNIYECRNCGKHVSSKDSPNSGSCQARNGNSHNWRKL